jgi:hypothetical protein
MTNTTDRINPLTELVRFLADSAKDCRVNRWLRAWFKFTVAQEIAKDVVASQAIVSQKAYSAEQADRAGASELESAVAELRAALADGELNKHDIPKLLAAIKRVQLARRHVLNSAQRDREISEECHVAA